MTEMNFQVNGMSCPVCQAHVQKAAAGVTGVVSANVDLAKKSLTIQLADGADASAVAPAVIAAVKKMGFEATQA